jgi:hypothetical protein
MRHDPLHLRCLSVHNFNVGWTIGGPDKAKPPLIIDPNAMLPFPISLQRLEAIPRRRTKVAQFRCGSEHI